MQPLTYTSAVLFTERTASSPAAFRNYEVTHATHAEYKGTIWESASATAAAPVYFRPVTLSSGTKCVDGGFMMGRNNPIEVALTEALTIESFKDREIGCVVSLGTGVPELNSVPGSALGVLLTSVKMLLDSERIARSFESKERGRDLRETDRYFRFNVPQGMHDLKLDDYEEIHRMQAVTDHYLETPSVGTSLQRCAQVLYKPDENGQ